MPPSWHPVPACVPRLRCRRGNLSCCSDGTAGGPFFNAATMVQHRFASLGLKSRIDARWLCDEDLQAKPFSVAAKKISIGRERSPPLRLLQAKLFSFAATKIRIGRGRSMPQRTLQAKLFFVAASVTLQRFPNLPPEIKNHCTLEDVSMQNLAVIPKFTP